jgi:GNAT superfamily N-acetyltransferase
MMLDFQPLVAHQADRIGQVMTNMDPWKRLGFGADSLTHYLLKPDSSLVRTVILDCGELVGAIAIRSPWLRGPYLELLAVFPDHQGRSIGRLALDWAFDTAKTNNALNFWACVSAFNHKARGFYAHMGFAETAELTDLVKAGEAEMLLRKVL